MAPLPLLAAAARRVAPRAAGRARVLGARACASEAAAVGGGGGGGGAAAAARAGARAAVLSAPTATAAPAAPPPRWRPPVFPSIAPRLRAAGADVCATYVRSENTALVAGYHDGKPTLDLRKTEEGLRAALQFIHALLLREPDAHVLFLHDDRERAPLTLRAAQLVGQSFMPKWVGGMLTNWRLVTRNVPGYLADRAAGQVPTERQARQMYRRMEKRFGYLRAGEFTPPALVVVMNLGPTTRAALQECELMNVPVVGLVDLDTNPKRFLYPIPANTRSTETVHAILDMFVRVMAPDPQTPLYDAALKARSKMLREFAAARKRQTFRSTVGARETAFRIGGAELNYEDPWNQFGLAESSAPSAEELYEAPEDDEVPFNADWTQEDEDALADSVDLEVKGLFEEEDEGALDGGDTPEGATYDASFILEELDTLLEDDAAGANKTDA